MPYVVAATWIAKDGEEGRVKEILGRLAPLVRDNETGNLQYQVHSSPDDPRVIFLYEQYVDEEAFEAHKNTPYFREYVVESAFSHLAERSAAFYWTIDD